MTEAEKAGFKAWLKDVGWLMPNASVIWQHACAWQREQDAKLIQDARAWIEKPHEMPNYSELLLRLSEHAKQDSEPTEGYHMGACPEGCRCSFAKAMGSNQVSQPKSCAVDGCDRDTASNGLCPKHWRHEPQRRANELHGHCRCSSTDGGGDCDWCMVYYGKVDAHEDSTK